MSLWYKAGVLSRPLTRESPDGDEDALLAELAQGSERALRTVYRHHHEAVRALARRLLGHEADAEELVQEVFVSLPAAMRGYRGQSSLRSFTLGITTNHARHFVRAAARRRSAVHRFAHEPKSELAPAADERVVREQLAERLMCAMDQLSHDQRVAFVLCEVEERSSEEAAAILGIPSSTIRARLGAARQKLQSLLSEEWP
ncbi:MAG TPA: RNA polymerase sigma factor [Polyangiaceae bacterium]|nr:RNA polymerase sigma factor [Polyangiaceae bacterium]